jgi:hypothetical protein
MSRETSGLWLVLTIRPSGPTLVAWGGVWMSPGGVIPPGEPVGGRWFIVTCLTCGWESIVTHIPDECPEQQTKTPEHVLQSRVK